MKLIKTRRNLVKDIASIQKRKAKELEDLVEIKLAKDKYETELIKIKTEICLLEQAIGTKKRKLEEEEREKEEQLDKELLEMARKKAAVKEADVRMIDKEVVSKPEPEADVKSPLRKMPEMVPARRLSIQTRHQDQGQDGRQQDRHLRPDHHRIGHFRSSQGTQDLAVSSQDWVLHPDVESFDQPVDLQKPREVKEEIKAEQLDLKKERKVNSVPPSTHYQNQTLRVRTNIVESKRSWMKDNPANISKEVTPIESAASSGTPTTANNSLEKAPHALPLLAKAREDWMAARRVEGAGGRSQSRDGGVWSVSSFHLPASRERRSSAASPGYIKSASPGYRELKDAVLFPTAMINSDPPAAASREGREKEQRINFLPGRERDGWARERNGSLPSRAEGLPSREGFLSNMGGRWGGGGGGAEASPAGAQQQQRRAPRTSPPVLHHHHQAPPDHPQFIPPPEALYLDHMALPIRPTPQRPPGLQHRPDYLPYPHQPQHPLNQQYSDHQAAHFRQLAARRRQEQERFLHQEFMKASRPAAAPAERQGARGQDFARQGQEAKSLHVAPSPQTYDTLKKASLSDEKCDGCGKEANFMCSACKGAHYCSMECQKERWPSHCRACLENKT